MRTPPRLPPPTSLSPPPPPPPPPPPSPATHSPGVRISLTIEVQDNRPGSKFHVVAELSGGLLNTGIGRLVARVLQAEVRKSVGNLAALR